MKAPLNEKPLKTLYDDACQFNLFAALRLIEKVYASQPRLGESLHTQEDAVRLRQPAHLEFPPSDVKSLHHDEDLERLVLEAYSFGLFGPNGALPFHVTEEAYRRDQQQHKDPTLSDFINVLQSRLTALFYRAWADTDPATNLDRPQSDRFQQYLGALIGLGMRPSWKQDSVHAYAKFGRAAWFGSRTRNAEGLCKILSDYFAVPAQIHNFVGEWITVPDEWRTRLGRRSSAERLSRRTPPAGAALGKRSWQCAHKFEITLGPLTYAQFKGFLPGAAEGSALCELGDLVRLYTNDEWSWQLRLQLAAGEIPESRLGKSRSQLGRTGWLRSSRKMVREVVIAGDLAKPRSVAHDGIGSSRLT